MPRGISQTDVWNACDALLLEGARPTIERVRQKIGSGSPNTVSPFLETWFRHLGGRIRDPGAFSAPSNVPDPVQQAAKHFWETALAETRRDFDQRLNEGMAAAIANVEAEKERAVQSDAAAFEATAKAAKLQGELAEKGKLLDQAKQDLAAERARLIEVRASLTSTTERLREQDTKSSAEFAEVKRQLAAAIERADAADRRVALELERERNSRAKAERHSESLQKSLDASQQAGAAADEQARKQVNAARDREEGLKTQLAAATAALASERQRLVELRASSETSSRDAEVARAQSASLQASLDRFAALVETGGRTEPKHGRKRASRPSP